MEVSLLSDELVRELTAVGQVDVLVGVPTLNNAGTVKGVVHAVAGAFDRYFHRDRTLLLNSDGGSTDGTTSIVRDLVGGDAGAVTVSHRLRTEHRISTPYHGLPGKGTALRQILTVAELLQARAVAILDAEVSTVTPEWIAALVRPVQQQQFDYVAPVYQRQPTEAPLVSQLVRPLMRAAYGWRVREPLAAEFGCSPRFLTHCLEQDIWTSELVRYDFDLWITGEALAAGFSCCQAPLGPRAAATSPDRPGFTQIFVQIVGAMIDCLEQHQSYWLSRAGSDELPVVGAASAAPAETPHIDGAPLIESFYRDLRDLQDVLKPILQPDTMAGLNAAAEAGGALDYTDELWAATVVDVLVAHRQGLMSRDHIARALVPLYLGRTGSFLVRHAHADSSTAAQALESLSLEFERRKPQLADRWTRAAKR